MEELILLSEPLRCNFCKTRVNDVVKFGPLYKLGKVKAHYFCVLLSHGLVQNGNDEEGMLGFLLKDIKEGLKRTKTTMCTYCGKKNATIICSGKKCLKKFHLPCGLENGSLHQFMNEFKSFCRTHRPVQCIPNKILNDAIQNGSICCICYERVEVTRKAENVLWAPCCRKTWYHRLCVQKLAHSAGYFFKCAACNDIGKFKARMERMGVYVPQQDASWERVPNAFAELLHRHDTCDAEICKCPDGRQKDEENTEFEIILCRSCGAQGVHVLCGGLSLRELNWECEVCQGVGTKSGDSKLSPEAAREMKECYLRKAGKSSSGPADDAWPPPAEEGASESTSTPEVGTTSTDERDVDESENGESSQSGEITEEEPEGEERGLEGETMEEKEENLEEGLLEDEVPEEQDSTEEESLEVEVTDEEEYLQEEENEEETLEDVIIEEQECIEEKEKGKDTLEGQKTEEQECLEVEEEKEETPKDGIMQEGEHVEEQEKREAKTLILVEEEEESKELTEEQQEGEAEQSVIIIEDESVEEWESREVIEEEENAEEHVKEEEEKLGEEMEEHENGEEAEIPEDVVMKEKEKEEREGMVEKQERREEGKWEEASLACPTEGSFMAMKSPVKRHRKRPRSIELSQDVAEGKKRKVISTCREEEEEEEEDGSVVDVESLIGGRKDAGTQTLEAEEESDGAESEPEESATSKGMDLREVMNAMKPAPLSHKIFILRKALERSSSPRHRRERLALFPQYKDIKPGPLSYKMNMLKRALDGEDLPPARHGEHSRNVPFADIKPGPRSYKRSVAQRASKGMTPSELKKHLVPRKRSRADVPIPKVSIIGMEPSASTSSAYREGRSGMTSVVADFEELSRGNLDRLREEHEVELEEWDGRSGGRSGGSRIRSRRVAEGTRRDEEGERKDASTQTNFRVRIWMMPTRLLPLRKHFEREQKKKGGGGP